MKRTLVTAGIGVALVGGTLMPASAMVFGRTDRPASEMAEPAVSFPVAAVHAASSATEGAPTTTLVPPSTTAAEPARPRPEPVSFRLSCGLRDDGASVVCEWNVPAVDGIRAYRVWRAERGDERVELGTTERRRWVDERVEAGHTYRYVVEAFGADTTLAVSLAATVSLPERYEPMRLACAARTIEGRVAVVCEWSESTREGVRAYRLVKQVGERPRETVADVPAEGRRRVVDFDVEPGQLVRYAVLALDASGQPIDEGGPVRVEVPRPAPTSTLTTIPTRPTGSE